MLEKKNCVINCDVCDTRNMQPDVFDGFEQVVINADIMVVNEKSKKLLNNYAIIMNTDDVLETEEEVKLHAQNGSYELIPGMGLEENLFLVVNGRLTIHPGAEGEVLRCKKITVNGSVKYPASMAGVLGNMTVNGQTYCYPDGSILLEDGLHMDKYFPLRARENGFYYSWEEIVIADEAIDLEKLKNKNVRFHAPELIVAEKMLESAISMFNDDMELKVIPEGFGYVDQDVKLDRKLLKKYGNRLFIHGDLSLDKESTPLLDQVEELKVQGDVYLLKEQEEKFLELDAEYQELHTARGKCLENKIRVEITPLMLQNEPEGILVRNAVEVTLSPELTPEQIGEFLQFENCAKIKCSREQKSFVQFVSNNVADISAGEDEDEDIRRESGASVLEKLMNTKVINADYYSL